MKYSAACLLFSSQGAGLYISGTATLTSSNVYENEAVGNVRSLFEPSVAFHPSPCACFLSLLFEPSQTVPPLPPWYAHCWRCVVADQRELLRRIEPTNVTFHCPHEMFCRLLAVFLAGCGALHLWHGNANQLKRVRERGIGICVLAF